MAGGFFTLIRGRKRSLVKQKETLLRLSSLPPGFGPGLHISVRAPRLYTMVVRLRLLRLPY